LGNEHICGGEWKRLGLGSRNPPKLGVVELRG
jgi:hypothetical protein